MATAECQTEPQVRTISTNCKPEDLPSEEIKNLTVKDLYSSIQDLKAATNAPSSSGSDSNDVIKPLLRRIAEFSETFSLAQEELKKKDEQLALERESKELMEKEFIEQGIKYQKKLEEMALMKKQMNEMKDQLEWNRERRAELA